MLKDKLNPCEKSLLLLKMRYRFVQLLLVFQIVFTGRALVSLNSLESLANYLQLFVIILFQNGSDSGRSSMVCL